MENLFPTCSVKLCKGNSCLSLRCKSQDKRFFQKKNCEFVFEKLVKNGTTITSFLHAKSYLTKAIQVCFYGVKLGRNNFLRTISDFLSKWLKVVQKRQFAMCSVKFIKAFQLCFCCVKVGTNDFPRKFGENIFKECLKVAQ